MKSKNKRSDEQKQPSDEKLKPLKKNFCRNRYYCRVKYNNDIISNKSIAKYLCHFCGNNNNQREKKGGRLRIT